MEILNENYDSEFFNWLEDRGLLNQYESALDICNDYGVEQRIRFNACDDLESIISQFRDIMGRKPFFESKKIKLFEEFFYRKSYKYIPIIIDNVVYLFDIKSISKLPNDRFSKNDIIIKLHRYGYKEEREITVRYSGERDWFSIIDYKGIDNAKLSEKGEKILRRYLR